MAIANFQSEGADAVKAPAIEKHLRDRLTKHLLQDVTTCLVSSVPTISSIPTTNGDAEELGKKLNAKIVIWGRLHSLGLEIYLTKVKTETSGFALEIPKTEAENFETQIQILPEIISVMTATAISDIYKQDKNKLAAQKVLESALDWIDSKNVNPKEKNMAERLANAYFKLGNLYNPSDSSERTCSTERESCLKAIKAYQRSAEINPQNQLASL